MYQLPTAVAFTFGWIGTVALGVIPDDMEVFWCSDAEPYLAPPDFDHTHLDATTDFDCFVGFSG
jgi:hypothetical protein